ncbi:3-hydroxy-9,10-secoandrosta-1,3,5(10)-triene-9,17-dione monooxygenase [Nitrospirillum amazonense]|uniref:3-hydroxy-9,10-secoandrosta-1,3,5(10)-triene-9, 17-dione monooxygenase n=1 Tax=Nitrospirillum amazonense TaxID=28077 RepID=A0A560FS21_9PROT|nr:3-hydroxy-9,10-secoandrosta-1,3,5(10)-triene-9,17-dione monooxygenase [Nitrospirillum amazonense]
MPEAGLEAVLDAPPVADDLSPVGILHRAQALLPLIDTLKAEGERERRAPAALIDALKRAGLFRLLQPRRYGGAECHPATFFAVQAALSAGDMSIGWLQGVMGMVAFHLALLPAQAQDDVWRDDPTALLACSYMPAGKATRVPGGFRLSGRWGFSSGADHADWFMLGAMAASEEGDTPEHVIFLVPRADVRIHDSWDTIGLRGTGSHDVSVEDGFVPAHRRHGVQERFLIGGPGRAVNLAPLYHIPLPQMLFRAISTPALGGLRGMLDAFIEHSRRRAGPNGGGPLVDPVAQLACGETAAELDEMTRTLEGNFDRMLDHARQDRDAPITDRMLYRVQATSVVERCDRLARRLFKAAGASALSVANPLGRICADIQAARQHAANQYEIYGRTLGAHLFQLDVKDTLL